MEKLLPLFMMFVYVSGAKPGGKGPKPKTEATVGESVSGPSQTTLGIESESYASLKPGGASDEVSQYYTITSGNGSNQATGTRDLDSTGVLLIVLLVTVVTSIVGGCVIYKVVLLMLARRYRSQVSPRVDKSKKVGNEDAGFKEKETANDTSDKKTEKGAEDKSETNELPEVKTTMMNQYTKFTSSRVTNEDSQKIQKHLNMLQNMPSVNYH